MIEKLDASQVYDMGGTYTTLPNDSLRTLNDAVTIAVWVSLISKPRDWEINCKNICANLKISRKKYYESVAILKQIDLCREYVKREKNKLCGKFLIIVSSPTDWEKVDQRLSDIQSASHCQFFLQAANRVKRGKNTHKNPEVSIIDTSQNVTCQNVTPHKRDTTQMDTHTNKVNIQITKKTNIAAARAAEQQVSFKRTASVEPPVSAAAFSEQDNSTTNDAIGEKLTLAQIQAVKQKLSSVVLNAGDSVATVQHAVLTSLVDDTQFTACHPHFAKKLNAIAKCYRAGTYFPRTVLAVKQQAQQVQKDQHAQQRLNDLREKYRQLAGDINHYETLLRANLTVHEAVKYAAIYAEKKRVLETMKHEIDMLKRQLGQNTNNLSFPEKRVGTEQPSTALSTELLTKIVNNSAADNGHVDSKSLGEGGC